VLKTAPWYELLNAGLRVTGVAGSDFPVPLNRQKPWPRWLPLLGPERALVKARPDENSYDSWSRGVRDGKVIVTNGPLVELSLDDKTGTVKATASFWRPIELLEIIRNGEVIAAKPGGTELSAKADCPESCWLAARVRAQRRDGEPEIQAHTNPAYLLRDGKPVRIEGARAAVRAKWEAQLSYYRSARIVFPSEDRKKEFFAEAEQALARLQ